MNSQEELRDAVKAALENRGILRDIRARMRAEVFRSLDDVTIERPPLSNANLLANSLINEYLEFNDYRHTESVLLAESGQSDAACLSRQFLCNELSLRPIGNAKKLPLLYSMVNYFLEKRHIPNSSHSNQRPISAAELEDEEVGDNGDARFIESARACRKGLRAEDDAKDEETGSARRHESAIRRSDEKDTRVKRDAMKPRTGSESQSDRRTSWIQGDSLYIVQD